MNQKLFKKLEIAGGGIVFLIAAFLHFLYKLSGGSVLGALFGAVNESVWEHIKIFSIGYLLWGMVELLWARPSVRKFLPAKAFGMYTMGISVALLYYIHVCFAGKSILVIDLLIGLISSILGHLISYKLTLSYKNQGQYFYTGIMLILLGLTMILCFSYFPPQNSLFRDPNTGIYGVPPRALDAGAVELDRIYMG